MRSTVDSSSKPKPYPKDSCSNRNGEEFLTAMMVYSPARCHEDEEGQIGQCEPRAGETSEARQAG
jgi:hypothetical protein